MRVLPWSSRKAQKSTLRLGFLVKDSQIMTPCNAHLLAHFWRKKLGVSSARALKTPRKKRTRFLAIPRKHHH
jgi:hypothetical protein